MRYGHKASRKSHLLSGYRSRGNSSTVRYALDKWSEVKGGVEGIWRGERNGWSEKQEQEVGSRDLQFGKGVPARQVLGESHTSTYSVLFFFLQPS